jgi:dTDP-glucose 4,6-dehydratase
MEKLLITGDQGFVGRNLKRFYQDKYQIFSWNRHDKIDLKKIKPDIIINTAAEIYNTDKMFGSNVVLCKTFLDYTKDNNTRLLQIGSSSELGMVDHPGREYSPINPINLYQGTKAAATMLCQSYAREFNLDITIARPYSLYGRYEKQRRLFPTLRLAAENKRVDPLELYAGVHDWIYIDDFIYGLDWIINRKSEPGEIFHFGTGKQTTNFKVFDLLQEFLGNLDCVILKDEFIKKYDSNMWVCDTRKTQRLGFETKFNLRDGIKHYLEGEI